MIDNASIKHLLFVIIYQLNSIPKAQVCDATGAQWYSQCWSQKEKTALLYRNTKQ